SASRTRTSRTSRWSATPSTTSSPSSGPRPLSRGGHDALLDALAQRLGVEFADRALLERAVGHRSFCAEHPPMLSNERLEFLGDAVLGLVVTDHIYRIYPDLPEGHLAKVRAAVVNSAALAAVAADLTVGDALLLGKGEAGSGGAMKPSILADAMEALIGATYLDGGWEAARDLVLRLLGERILDAAAGPGGQDHKTRLQELASSRFRRLPSYTVVEAGPDHAKRFVAAVVVDGRRWEGVEGRSKKQAEQAAACQAWTTLAAEIAAGLNGDDPTSPEQSGA
ncbi:MAG: ribonuclease III, partial [Acidimicrobiales bacterium]